MSDWREGLMMILYAGDQRLDREVFVSEKYKLSK